LNVNDIIDGKLSQLLSQELLSNGEKK